CISDCCQITQITTSAKSNETSGWREQKKHPRSCDEPHRDCRSGRCDWSGNQRAGKWCGNTHSRPRLSGEHTPLRLGREFCPPDPGIRSRPKRVDCGWHRSRLTHVTEVVVQAETDLIVEDLAALPQQRGSGPDRQGSPLPEPEVDTCRRVELVERPS